MFVAFLDYLSLEDNKLTSTIMSIRLILFILILLSSGVLQSQIKQTELYISPSIYNNADSSIIELKRNLNIEGASPQTAFFHQWALLKLYHHLGNTSLCQSVLENIIQRSKQIAQKDFLVIALAEKIRIYDDLNDRINLKETYDKLKALHLTHTSLIAEIEYQFIHAKYFIQKSDFNCS